jgi:hypothetical protein
MGQTGVRVQILATWLGLVATGVGPDSALLPTGAGTCWLVLMAPCPAARWLATSTIATACQVPGWGRSTSAR